MLFIECDSIEEAKSYAYAISSTFNGYSSVNEIKPTRIVKQKFKVAKESKTLLNNIKHWLGWLTQEVPSEKTKTEIAVLVWTTNYLKETEKLIKMEEN